MNKTSKPEQKIFDAVFADENWRALDARCGELGISALRTRKRKRLFAVCAPVLVGLVVICSNGGWLRSKPTTAALTPATAPVTASVPVTLPSITEEEMLALFPAGSCVIAEVDGHRQLVFFDPLQAKEGFALHAH